MQSAARCAGQWFGDELQQNLPMMRAKPFWMFEQLQAIVIAASPAMSCRQDLTVATSQLGDLFGRVRDIQRKAADSEVLVQEICRDIRKVRQSHWCPCSSCITVVAVSWQLRLSYLQLQQIQAYLPVLHGIPFVKCQQQEMYMPPSGSGALYMLGGGLAKPL